MRSFDWDSFWIAVCVLAGIALVMVIAVNGFEALKRGERERNESLRVCLQTEADPIMCMRIIGKG